jgi:hypothetical protein
LRSQIAAELHDLDPDGASALWEVVNMLGVDGQSSDESDNEQESLSECSSSPTGRLCYTRKLREWRSDEVSDLLYFIDSCRKKRNGYGNKKAGKEPTQRLHSESPTVSTRAPVPGLPRNFYNDAWYACLTPEEEAGLGAIESMELPGVE